MSIVTNNFKTSPGSNATNNQAKPLNHVFGSTGFNPTLFFSEKRCFFLKGELKQCIFCLMFNNFVSDQAWVYFVFELDLFQEKVTGSLLSMAEIRLAA